MKSWGYIVIFVAVIAIIGGLIWYNVQDINDITSDVVTVSTKKSATKNAQETSIFVEQKEINVLLDEDFESDVLDTVSESDENYFGEMDIFTEEGKAVVF